MGGPLGGGPGGLPIGYFFLHFSMAGFMEVGTRPDNLQHSPAFFWPGEGAHTSSPRAKPATATQTTTKAIDNNDCIVLNGDQLFRAVYIYAAKVTHFGASLALLRPDATGDFANCMIS